MTEIKEPVINEPTTPTPNVILFGETGSGKSSIVNMLAQSNRANTSSSAKGCTFSTEPYLTDILGTQFKIWDTAGLNEGEGGTIPPKEAVIQLLRLLKQLDTGVSLLVFCMRAPRIKENLQRNWHFFYEVMCKRQVPIVLAITGLENEESDMDDWWIKNQGMFQNLGIIPNGIACITAIRGRKQRFRDSEGREVHVFDDVYRESKNKLGKAIKMHCLAEPWKVEPTEWFKHIVTVTYETDCFGRVTAEHKTFSTIAGSAIQALAKVLLISQKEAEAMGKTLEQL